MSDTYIFSFLLIFLLWIFTTVALLLSLKKLRSVKRPDPDRQMDIFMGLATVKNKEAKEASRKLHEAANAMHIGLLELSDKEVKPLNKAVSELLPIGIMKHSKFLDFLFSLPSDGQKGMEIGKKVINFKKITSGTHSSLILAQDITEAYNMAKNLKQREKLVILGQMTAQMAHQIKTPIAVLAGNAQLLVKKLDTLPELKDQARDIYLEARKLAERINEIVRFYKDPEPVMAMTVIRGILDDVKERLAPLASKDVEIVVDCPQDLTVSTDEGILKNLLFLLGQNAISPDVCSKRLFLEAGKKSGHVDIQIRDDGKGISEEMRDKIFEPFSGTKQEGLGLGLFLAKGLSRKIKGSLELLDAQAGTAFLLRLPCNS